MPPTVSSLYRPHAEAPARLRRRARAACPAPGSSAFDGLASEAFELISRGDFVSGRLDGPASDPGATRALIVLLHDVGGSATAEALDVAAAWARQGVRVARPDLPLHGARRSPKLSERLENGCTALADGDALDPDTHALVEEFARQSVSDVLRTLEALAAEDDVDARRILLVGLGLGGQVAAWCAPHARSLAACALAGGVGRLADPDLDPAARLDGEASPETAYFVEICATGGHTPVEAQEAILAALPPTARRIESASATRGVLSPAMADAIGAWIGEVLD